MSNSQSDKALTLNRTTDLTAKNNSKISLHYHNKLIADH